MKKKCDLIKRLKNGECARVLLYHHIDLDGYGTLVLMKYLEKLFPNLELYTIECDTDAERISIDNDKMCLFNFDYIFIADLSVKTKETAELIYKLNDSKKLNVYIVDHHETALWLDKFEYATIVPHDLDNNVVTCGTSLLFDLIKGDTKTCELDNGWIIDFIKNVKEYDTFLWKLNGNKQAYDLNLLLKFSDDKNKFVKDIVETLNNTTYVLGYYDTQNSLRLSIYSDIIKNEIELAEKMYNKINIIYKGKELVCGYLYINKYQSEIGNAICEKHNDIDFMMMINANNGKVSFRSTKNNINLTEFVKPLGGGGHKSAAGCELPLNKYNCSIEETLSCILNEIKQENKEE